MATERFRPTEKQISAEYWQGHSVQDECPVGVDLTDITQQERKKINKIMNKEVMRSRPFYDKACSEAREVFSAFLEKGASVPLAEFKPGSVFRPQDYNPGTILLCDNEIMWWKADGEPQYDRSDVYYVIHGAREGKEKIRMLIYFGILDNRRISSGFPFEEKEISVGNVGHFRSKDAMWTNEGVRDTLTRVNKVSVLQAGTSSPEEIPRLRRGFTRMVFGGQKSA